MANYVNEYEEQVLTQRSREIQQKLKKKNFQASVNHKGGGAQQVATAAAAKRHIMNSSSYQSYFKQQTRPHYRGSSIKTQSSGGGAENQERPDTYNADLAQVKTQRGAAATNKNRKRASAPKFTHLARPQKQSKELPTVTTSLGVETLALNENSHDQDINGNDYDVADAENYTPFVVNSHTETPFGES